MPKRYPALPLLVTLFVTAVTACAPATPPPSGAPTTGTSTGRAAIDRITEDDLRRDLFALAGDDMRGRQGGTLDEMRASVWVAERAREAGLEPAGDDGTYFQFFSLGRTTQSEESAVIIGSERLRFPIDFVVTTRTSAFIDAPVVMVGDGAQPDASVAGKIAVMRITSAAAAALGEVSARRGPGPQDELAVRLQRLIMQQGNAARDAGAVAAFLVVDPSFEQYFLAVAGQQAMRGQYLRDTLPPTATPGGGRGGGQGGQLPAAGAVGGRGGQGGAPAIPVLIFRSGALAQLGSSPATARVQLSIDRFVYPSVNVVAKVPGTDAALRNEYVLYSAHQDHDGVRHVIDGDSIWNGADDNATVAVALLAIGRAVRAAPPRRSSLFVWHGSEERGLHGSYWFAGHPTVPRASIVAVLNGDMIGRNHPDTAALLGSQPPHRNSASLAATALAANDRVTRFAIDSSWDRTTHSEGWYFRSDHLPYACVGVPALFFTTLLHADYHTPKDEPDRIDIRKLRRMTQWMYATGYTVGNASDRPTVDPGFQLERPCQIRP